MSDATYQGFGLNLGGGKFGGGNYSNRIAVNMRVKNLMNAIKSAQEYGVFSPAPYANLATGFAEANQKLLRGDQAAIKDLRYPYPIH